MKKFVVGLIAALMMAAGLVAVSGASANAKACGTYGSDCFRTYSHVYAPDKVVRHHRATICVKVTTQGNGTPKGRVTVKVVRANGGFKWVDTKPYNGGKVCFTTPKLHKLGGYVIAETFDRKPGSRWKDSDNRAGFTVVRNR